MGFFSGFIKKPSGVFQIVTAQGSRIKVERIVPALRDYLTRAGGAVRCSIKEERVAQWWMSEPGLRLPPVIDRVQALTDRGAR